jgi:hypothetical protein
MAVIHRAHLSPTKRELLAGWLPSRSWSGYGHRGEIELLGAYRFDDAAGAVGIETHLVRTDDGRLLQVPLTYREAPLPGAGAFLVGTSEHSALGRRWVYDGCGDAVYATALAAAILTGGREAEEWVEQAGGPPKRRESTALVVGSGTPGVRVPAIGSVMAVDEATTTAITGPRLRLIVLRVLGGAARADEDAQVLTGTWSGNAEPTVLAYALPLPE